MNIMNKRTLLLRSSVSVVALVGMIILKSFAAEDRPQPPVEVLQAEQERIEAIEQASRCTVAVFGSDGQGGGSGVVVSPDGYVVTNFHVTSPCGDFMRCGLSDGNVYDAVIVGIDPTGDLAVVKMYGRDDFPVAVLGDSDHVEIGQWCFAAGNPFLLATNLQPTITFGLISGVHRYQEPAGTILEYTDCIQTDAAINPGNSGGPLFNSKGELIGINGRCSFEKRGRVNVGVGYAISINQVKNFLGHLKSGAIVDHATMGFTVATDPDGRILVTNILESSDAFRRGIRYGDEILAIGGKDIHTVNQLKNIVGIYPEGWRIAVRFRHAEATEEVPVRLQRLHTLAEMKRFAGEQNQPPSRKPNAPEDKSPPMEKRSDDQPTPLAERLKDRFVRRDGYANFYFNRVELDRILNAPQTTLLNQFQTDWQIRGKLIGEVENAHFAIGSESTEARFGPSRIALTSDKPWSQIVEERKLESLLIGIRLFQQWHQMGPRAMGDVVYVGTSPILGESKLLDVVRVAADDLDVRFYVDAQGQGIKLIELYSDEKLDPAEIYFRDYSERNGLVLPSKIFLQFGNEVVLGILQAQFSFDESK